MTVPTASFVSLTAPVRAHLGVSLPQLARYLGVSASFVSHLEAGRKPLPAALLPRLLRLLSALPPPLGQGPPAVPLPPPYNPLLPLPAPEQLAPPLPEAPAPEPLRRRLRDQRLRLLTLGTELAAAQTRAAALHHRRLGLARLHTLPPPPEAAEAAHLARWLQALAEDLRRDDPDPAARAAALHLLAARVAGLRAEVAALGAPQ
ncbi:helix-turn-helix domain-containing protein [Hymenobacter perfusus]|nr:helix-turn-helix domain-containing protein [Hymenobacter perfusus]